MGTVTISQELFSDEHPNEEGTYLWKNSMGVELINVYYYKERHEYGIHWDSYYGIPSMGGRNIRNLLGSFLKIEVV